MAQKSVVPDATITPHQTIHAHPAPSHPSTTIPTPPTPSSPPNTHPHPPDTIPQHPRTTPPLAPTTPPSPTPTSDADPSDPTVSDPDLPLDAMSPPSHPQPRITHPSRTHVADPSVPPHPAPHPPQNPSPPRSPVSRRPPPPSTEPPASPRATTSHPPASLPSPAASPAASPATSPHPAPPREPHANTDASPTSPPSVDVAPLPDFIPLHVQPVEPNEPYDAPAPCDEPRVTAHASVVPSHPSRVAHAAEECHGPAARARSDPAPVGPGAVASALHVRPVGRPDVDMVERPSEGASPLRRESDAQVLRDHVMVECQREEPRGGEDGDDVEGAQVGQVQQVESDVPEDRPAEEDEAPVETFEQRRRRHDREERLSNTPIDDPGNVIVEVIDDVANDRSEDIQDEQIGEQRRVSIEHVGYDTGFQPPTPPVYPKVVPDDYNADDSPQGNLAPQAQIPQSPESPIFDPVIPDEDPDLEANPTALFDGPPSRDFSPEEQLPNPSSTVPDGSPLSPIYVPEREDADVRLGHDSGDGAPLSEHVKESLAMLPLQNVAVVVPNFTRYNPPSANDMAVVRALEDILRAERERRSRDAFAVSKPLKSILIITGVRKRANVWYDLLSNHSSLHTATHGVYPEHTDNSARAERGRREDSKALDSLFALKDAIITLDKTALTDANRNYLYLRRVALLVFDCIDFIGRRSHPSAVLMRDFYRALPFMHRPRVLAISGKPLDDGHKPPIEHNVFAAFIPEETKQTSFWKSCYGAGCRTPDSGLLDIEVISYVPSTSSEREGDRSIHDLRKTVGDLARSELEVLVQEVGPLGAALYQRRRRYRRFENGTKFGRGQESINSMSRLADKSCLNGLSFKCLCLLNELERGFAASTVDDKLMAIIYAGQPAVASALGEVISALPVFEGVTARVVIGCDGAKSFEPYDREDDSEKCRWQGEDTDDESVTFFTAGEANLLIVASPYCAEGRRNHVIPPCPFVLRFDGSAPDPVVDGGFGRCRVVLFRKKMKRRRSPSVERNGHAERNGQNDAVHRDEEMAVIEYDAASIKKDGNEREKAVAVDIPEGAPDIAIERVSNSDIDVHPESDKQTVAPNIALRRGSEHKNVTDPDIDEEKVSVYYSKPPVTLRGAKGNGADSCFLYRMFLHGSSLQNFSSSKAEPMFIGIEDFLLVLSEKLTEEDLMVSLEDFCSSRRSTSAFLKLEFQGCVSLNEKQVGLARQYTAALCCLTSPTLKTTRFFWEGISETDDVDADSVDAHGENPTDLCFLRRYLLLPARRENSETVQREASKNVKEGNLKHSKLFRKYFFPSRRGSDGGVHSQRCSIDWENVQEVLALEEPDTKFEESCKTSGLKPSQFPELEARFVFSSFPGTKAAFCGQLKHDVSPLTSLVRSKKFELKDDGTFVPNEELNKLIGLYVTEGTLKNSSRISTKEGEQDKQKSDKEGNTLGVTPSVKSELKNGSHEASKIVSARWCERKSRLVADKRVIARRRKRGAISKPNRTTFDPPRNVEKKRKTWVGRMRYTIESNWKKYHSKPVRVLDQPLLPGASFGICEVEDLLEAANGTSVQEICDKLVSKSPDAYLMPPELCRIYPVSIGAIFLPAVLLTMERHLSVCELRQRFDPRIGVRGNIKELLHAVTAAHVNPSGNYERLELLGDSVLKLSCTLRLFVSRPHDTEGQMHKSRAYRVSNERLHRLGHKKGLHNYLRFRHELLADWKPPGTDIRGKEQKISQKPLADVVEAICGAYFLFGANMPDAMYGADLAKISSTSEIECDSDSDSSSESEDEIVGEKRKKREALKTRKRKRRAQERSGELYRPFSAEVVERGYIAAYKFLEECNVFDDSEPTHKGVLLSAIHAMHPRGSPAPTEISLDSFPFDERLSCAEIPWEQQFGPLEDIIGYRFKRRHLLMSALTHSSFVRPAGTSTPEQQTYQRLEFLGDAAADFCVVRYLYDKYPELGPGELTNLKSNVVSNESFARTAVKLGIHKYLFHNSTSFTAEVETFVKMVEEDVETGNADRLKRSLGELAAPKVLGDIFEGIIGAILVDSGLQQVWRVCMRLLKHSLCVNADPMRDDVHPCSLLQDLVMRVWKVTSSAPRYDLESEGKGSRRKVASITILGEKIASGRGSTSKRAKLMAAEAALKLLQDPDPASHGAQLLRKLMEEGVRRRVAAQRDFG